MKSSPSETADDALSLAVLIFFFTVEMISPDTLSLLAYMKNGNDIFKKIILTCDEIMPQKVIK